MSNKVKFYSITAKNTNTGAKMDDIAFLFNEMERKRIAEKEKGKIDKSEFQHKICGKEMTFFEFSRDPNNNSYFVIPFGTKKRSSIYKEESDIEMSTKVTEVVGKLYDLSSLYYDAEEKVAILYEERASPSAKYIAAYLNMVFKEFGENSYECIIEPIYYYAGLSTIEKAEKVTKIVLSLNLSENEERIYDEDANCDTLTGTLFKAVKSMKKDMNAKTFTLELGVGNKGKKACLNKSCVLQLISSLHLDETAIKEVTIYYKNGDITQEKPAKLKEEYISLTHEFKDTNIQFISPEYLIVHGKEAIKDKRPQYREYLRSKNRALFL